MRLLRSVSDCVLGSAPEPQSYSQSSRTSPLRRRSPTCTSTSSFKRISGIHAPSEDHRTHPSVPSIQINPASTAETKLLYVADNNCSLSLTFSLVKRHVFDSLAQSGVAGIDSSASFDLEEHGLLPDDLSLWDCCFLSNPGLACLQAMGVGSASEWRARAVADPSLLAGMKWVIAAAADMLRGEAWAPVIKCHAPSFPLGPNLISLSPCLAGHMEGLAIVGFRLQVTPASVKEELKVVGSNTTTDPLPSNTPLTKVDAAEPCPASAIMDPSKTSGALWSLQANSLGTSLKALRSAVSICIPRQRSGLSCPGSSLSPLDHSALKKAKSVGSTSGSSNKTEGAAASTPAVTSQPSAASCPGMMRGTIKSWGSAQAGQVVSWASSVSMMETTPAAREAISDGWGSRRRTLNAPCRSMPLNTVNQGDSLLYSLSQETANVNSQHGPCYMLTNKASADELPSKSSAATASGSGTQGSESWTPLPKLETTVEEERVAEEEAMQDPREEELLWELAVGALAEAVTIMDMATGKVILQNYESLDYYSDLTEQEESCGAEKAAKIPQGPWATRLSKGPGEVPEVLRQLFKLQPEMLPEAMEVVSRGLMWQKVLRVPQPKFFKTKEREEASVDEPPTEDVKPTEGECRADTKKSPAASPVLRCLVGASCEPLTLYATTDLDTENVGRSKHPRVGEEDEARDSGASEDLGGRQFDRKGRQLSGYKSSPLHVLQVPPLEGTAYACSSPRGGPNSRRRSCALTDMMDERLSADVHSIILTGASFRGQPVRQAGLSCNWQSGYLPAPSSSAQSNHLSGPGDSTYSGRLSAASSNAQSGRLSAISNNAHSGRLSMCGQPASNAQPGRLSSPSCSGQPGDVTDLQEDSDAPIMWAYPPSSLVADVCDEPHVQEEDSLPRESSAEGAMAETKAFKEGIQVDDAPYWKEVNLVPQTTSSGRMVLVIVQKDISSQVELAMQLADSTEILMDMLKNMFPRHVLEFFVKQPVNVPLSKLESLGRSYDGVSIMFMDICGFTSMSREVSAPQVMSFLNELFTKLDCLVDIYNVYKVETAGDCYIVAGGLTDRDATGVYSLVDSVDPREGARRVSGFALALLQAAETVPMPHNGLPTKVRVGIHTGEVTAGVIGTKLPKFSLFGDTMNTASRMESTCPPMHIQVSKATYSLLAAPSPDIYSTRDLFPVLEQLMQAETMEVPSLPGPYLMQEHFQFRGPIEIKGKGMMETFICNPAEGANIRIESRTTVEAMSASQTSAFHLLSSHLKSIGESMHNPEALLGQNTSIEILPGLVMNLSSGEVSGYHSFCQEAGNKDLQIPGTPVYESLNVHGRACMGRFPSMVRSAESPTVIPHVRRTGSSRSASGFRFQRNESTGSGYASSGVCFNGIGSIGSMAENQQLDECPSKGQALDGTL